MNKLNIYKRKDGRFEGRCYLEKDERGNRKYRSFYGKSAEEVITKYKDSLIVVSDVSSICTVTEMTVSELFTEWLRIISHRIKVSTLANYRMKADKHILPAFGNIRCADLEKKTVYSFVDLKIKNGLSVRYVWDIIVLLKSVFKYANREYGVKNVIDGIFMPKKQHSSIRILTKSEHNVLRNHIKKEQSLTDLGIAVSMYTGLRIGELCALQWRDIDIEKRTLTVSKTIQRIQLPDGEHRTRLVITEPKSEKSRREIPIPDCLISMLKKHKTGEHDYILSGGSYPVEPRTMQYRFAKILEKAGLPKVHFHSLRHAFATRAIELGFDIKTLSELLGHSSVELTMNLYVHSSMERKRECMELMKWSA